jgi:hypothetical protein
VEVRVPLKIMMQEVMHGGFPKCFKQLYECWQQCVAAERQYFEGNYINGLLEPPYLRYGYCPGATDFITLKIHRPRPGLNPRTVGPVASMLTTRSPGATH